MSCRQYNIGLAHRIHLKKLLNEYLPKHSLSQFVKKVPKENDDLIDDVKVNSQL